MKNLVWFVFGIAGGFVLAHLVDKDPRGHELLAEIDARIGEFTDRMSDAYRAQEAKFFGDDASERTAAPAVGGDDDVPTPKDVAEHTTVAQVAAVAGDDHERQG